MEQKILITGVINESVYYIENTSSLPKGIIGKCKVLLTILNKVTLNGTYYSDDWYKKAIVENNNFKYKLENKLLLGELDHPANVDGSIEKISHCVSKIWKEGNNIWGIVEIFDSPNGRILWTLLNAGVKLSVSSRGVGDHVFENGYKVIVGDTFDLKAWDFVINPSNVGCGFDSILNESAKIVEVSNKFVDIYKKYNNNVGRYIVESVMNDYKKVEDNENIKIINELNDRISLLESENKRYKEEINRMKLMNEKYNVSNSNSLINASKQIEEMKKEIDELKLTNGMYLDEIDNKNKIIENLQKELNMIKNEKLNNVYNVILNKKEVSDRDINLLDNIYRSYIPKYKK